MIDCGADWLGRLDTIAPTAIVLTHAHPDHAFGLAEGAPCPVYATEETLDLLRRFPIHDRRRMPLRRSKVIAGVSFKAFPVHHSIRAPAVGYRVSLETIRFFYLPDVAAFPRGSNALSEIILYIGDGATVQRTMVRRQRGTRIGHAAISVQLGWCETAGISHAIFTHCGSEIVRGDARHFNPLVRRLGHKHGIDARLAHDGEQLCFQAVSSAVDAPKTLKQRSVPDGQLAGRRIRSKGGECEASKEIVWQPTESARKGKERPGGSIDRI